MVPRVWDAATTRTPLLRAAAADAALAATLTTREPALALAVTALKVQVGFNRGTGNKRGHLHPLSVRPRGWAVLHAALAGQPRVTATVRRSARGKRRCVMCDAPDGLGSTQKSARLLYTVYEAAA